MTLRILCFILIIAVICFLCYGYNNLLDLLYYYRYLSLWAAFALSIRPRHSFVPRAPPLPFVIENWPRRLLVTPRRLKGNANGATFVPILL